MRFRGWKSEGVCIDLFYLERLFEKSGKKAKFFFPINVHSIGINDCVMSIIMNKIIEILTERW